MIVGWVAAKRLGADLECGEATKESEIHIEAWRFYVNEWGESGL